MGTIWEPLWALWGLHFRHDLGTRGAATSYEVEFRDLFFHASYKHTEASCRPQERSETAAEDVTASCTKSHQELPDVPYKDNTMIVHCIYIRKHIHIYTGLAEPMQDTKTQWVLRFHVSGVKQWRCSPFGVDFCLVFYRFWGAGIGFWGTIWDTNPRPQKPHGSKMQG